MGTLLRRHYGKDNYRNAACSCIKTYIMAYHADNTIPDNIDDWLDQFEMFSIYEVLPEILALWGTNLITDIDSKKNLNAVAGR